MFTNGIAGNRFRPALPGFARDERGSFATLAGVSMLAVSLCAGVAVDYTRIAHTKSVMNNALDAAVLATGNLMSSGTANQQRLRGEFEDFFQANLESRNHHANLFEIIDFKADPVAGTVSAESSANVKMAFLGLAGHSEVDVGSASQARFSTDAVEVAMVLDVTGSMEGAKLAALKSAAGEAIDTLLPEGSGSGKVRVGLVPYSWSVNAGRYASRSTRGGSDRCVTERVGRNAYNDTFDRVGADERATGRNLCPSSEVMALSDNPERLKRHVGDFFAWGSTAGHIGVAWGYYMLSEKWRDRAWRGNENPARYGDGVKKIAVLMTDGAFNTYYTGNGRDANPWKGYEDESADHAVKLCADMKAAKSGNPGITIYSIAFKAGREAENMMRNCASPDAGQSVHYFDADNEEELREAFQAIAIDITKLRLSR
jgi:Flp pilus assembly protein TadG